MTTPNIVDPTMVEVVSSVLHAAKSLIGRKISAITLNNMQQGVQTNATSAPQLPTPPFLSKGPDPPMVTSNNVGSCWPTMLRLFA